MLQDSQPQGQERPGQGGRRAPPHAAHAAPLSARAASRPASHYTLPRTPGLREMIVILFEYTDLVLTAAIDVKHGGGGGAGADALRKLRMPQIASASSRKRKKF
ncbi:hypothetical protein EVAR_36928_1 [Eumeta japonica]|uniref:Uncharacterized protein n=1 Tax=Eumeta variegata TaxID=151549 RepID=A0A4C1X3Z2_EUMVA|nr:hypothetical protein EVAR_36928_1 [Eumeta japonica]